MHRHPNHILCCLLLVIASQRIETSFAQGSRADYARAASLVARTRSKVYRSDIKPNWIGDESRFWYRVQTGAETFRFILVDAVSGDRGDAFDHAQLAAALAKASGSAVDADRLPFENIRFGNVDAPRAVLHFMAFDRQWTWNNDTRQLTPGDTQASSNGTTVRILNREKPSGQSAAETEILFDNRRTEPVTLFWINQAGVQVAYGTIPARTTHAQHTFSRHVWLIVDAGNKPIAVFEAIDASGVAIIDEHSTLATNRHKIRAGRHSSNSSPDRQWEATIKDHNVVLLQSSNGDRIRLSTNGTADDPYVNRMHWSPDGTHLVVMQERVGDNREIHMIESSPSDQVQPKLHTRQYTKPGDNIPQARPRLFDIGRLRAVSIVEDLFPNPWSITNIHWWPDSKQFTFLYNQRGHQVLRWIAVDASSGVARCVVDERSETFIDYAGKHYAHQLVDTDELIWMSERDGWNHLYLIDATTGTISNQITQGDWVVRKVDRIDPDRRQIWFQAGGIHPGQDPYHIHFCRINFDGTGLTILTDGDGTHSVSWSPDRTYFVDSWSRVDQPEITELRRTVDGTLVCKLEDSDTSDLRAAEWSMPQRFTSKGRDGTTDIHGVIWRPSNHDSDTKYPVIEYIYAGPHSAFVPKKFSTVHRIQATLAEIGFIVVQIDGMGTSHRSKAFHDVCWQNLGDSGFPDRMAWIRAAAELDPSMDLSRVGIFGGSAGGQSSTRALLAHGDFYHVGVSDCGCHDNRMDKIWWNELWMGWPIGPHYAEQSNVTHARRLTGKLLLIVGELDKNVDPASTMQVVNALIKADKDFDLLVVPGGGHGIAESLYGTRRRTDFFVRHLFHVEPRH